ncbi:MAG: pteridine reductase [Pseudohongiellaceae bacterium]
MQQNKPVVLVTGAARRIGACILEHFHSRGFNSILHYNRSEDEARRLSERLNAARPDSVTTLQADLTDSSSVNRLAQQAVASYGRLDVLVNNASTFYATPLSTATDEDWNTIVDSNLKAAYFLSQFLTRALRDRNGAIVNIIDIHADKPLPNYSIYNIAKAGLKAMTRSLARDLAPDIRVNGVAPGAILWPEPAAGEAADPALEKQVLDEISLGRLGRPEDIATLAYFLASEATYLTGEVIRVDGGRYL